MTTHLVFLTLPGLRRADLNKLPALRRLHNGHSIATLNHSFPSVTWPAQATMLTGCHPNEHGVIANGTYWRERCEVEMWTAWNKVIQRPQIWDLLKAENSSITTAAWFPMLAKGCGADYVCVPAPIHKPDGSEELWCYTQPQELYGDLLQALGHFPLQHFWGPLANIKSSQWIADSAIRAAQLYRPNFFYIYLPHLDYAAQKFGPSSPQAMAALAELDQLISRLVDEMTAVFSPELIEWIAASEYVIRDVNHVSFPNRVLRKVGLLDVDRRLDGEHLDFQTSRAWALVDHQFSHVFVKNRDADVISKVTALFKSTPGISEVISGSGLIKLGMNHERCGDVVLVSEPSSWQAYYWWLDDNLAPAFARTVDIHRKPGYDPVELFFDPQTKSIPLRAEMIRGSHGVIVPGEEQGIFLSSREISGNSIRDVQIKDYVIDFF